MHNEIQEANIDKQCIIIIPGDTQIDIQREVN